ncbi:hypothetical protein Tco_1066837 [Tanacetum coccineum]|uniref:Uncharacterized protein n=1 Tax=Tanacetum coccineum TaxID=301880 RepID=A0ABQ5HBR9_9ASTR
MLRLMAAAKAPFRVRAKEDMELPSSEQLVQLQWILTTKDCGPSGKVVSGIHVRLLLTRGPQQLPHAVVFLQGALSVLVIENGKLEWKAIYQFRTADVSSSPESNALQNV